MSELGIFEFLGESEGRSTLAEDVEQQEADVGRDASFDISWVRNT